MIHLKNKNKISSLKYPLYLGLFILLFCGLAPSAFAVPKKLVLAIISEPSDDAVTLKLAEAISKEAYLRLGIEYFQTKYPALRANLKANEGEVDGELVRGFKYGDSYPNLIRVNEPILKINIAAYSTNSKLKLDKWDDLKGTNLRVDYLRGRIFLKEQLGLRIPKERLFELDYRFQLVERLLMGRSDIFIDIENDIDKLLRSKYNGKNVAKIGIITDFPLYTYLHKKHQDLVPALEKVLRKMKKDGTMKKIEDRVLEVSKHNQE